MNHACLVYFCILKRNLSSGASWDHGGDINVAIAAGKYNLKGVNVLETFLHLTFDLEIHLLLLLLA